MGNIESFTSNRTNTNDRDKEYEERDPSFNFFVHLAPYNLENDDIGEIKLYKVNCKTKVIDFIKRTFQPHEWNIVHLYNCAPGGKELDKYTTFNYVLHYHLIIELVYLFETDKNYHHNSIKLRGFRYLELRDRYDKAQFKLEREKNINLLLKNIVDKKILTKEFSVDKSIKVDDFIKANFNPTIIMIHEGNIINEEKTFKENNLIFYEKQYEIYYFEKKRENFSENGYIVRNYAILEKIGKGGYGKVYRVIDIRNLKEYALKEIEFSPNNKGQVENEIRLLSQLRNKYIVKYYESFQINNYYYILMELCSDKNLFDITRDTKKENQTFEENFIWEFFLKICIGVGYLHKKHVIHRDLKTSNIFLTKNGNVKIGDLGISKLLETTNMQMKTTNGTPYYSAPELWNYQQYDRRVDSWGMGCILYELCKLDYPFYDDSIIALKEAICSADYSPIPTNYSENMKKAISQLFEVDQNKRIDVKSFLLQDYIVNIAEKVGLLPELNELYPLEIQYQDNDIINHIYKNILRRNNILNEELFNTNFNKDSNAWKNKNDKISSYSLDYYPPMGWFGIGLNINKYNDNNNWLDKKTGWATAYHGLRLLETKEKRYNINNCNKYDLNRKLELTIKSIIENGLKNGINQPFIIEPNDNSLSKDEYNLCGEGIYLSFK